MFYPGDPMEQRKRQLIAKLSGSRGGRGAGGFKVGRVPGFFGRGVAGGFNLNPGQGRAFGQVHNPNLAATPFSSFTPPAASGGPQQWWGPSMFPIEPQTQHPATSPILQELLKQYGQAPSTWASGKWGQM